MALVLYGVGQNEAPQILRDLLGTWEEGEDVTEQRVDTSGYPGMLLLLRHDVSPFWTLHLAPGKTEAPRGEVTAEI